MSIAVSEPIPLRGGPINGHIRVISDIAADRVVLVVRTNRGTHTLDLIPTPVAPRQPPKTTRKRR